MKTLTLLRHFEFDENQNIRPETISKNAPLLAQIFLMRATPHPSIGPQLSKLTMKVGVSEIPLEAHENQRRSTISLSRGLGPVDLIASSSIPRAIQTADGLAAHLIGTARAPNQEWAGENYTGDKYKSFHATMLATGEAKIDSNDFTEFAEFLSSIPPDANHVVLVSHLPTIRALALACTGGGDVQELNALEHGVRDNGNGNPERYGFALSFQTTNWSGFAKGDAVLADKIRNSNEYDNLAFTFHLADKMFRKAPDRFEYLSCDSPEEQRELALRPYTHEIK